MFVVFRPCQSRMVTEGTSHEYAVRFVRFVMVMTNDVRISRHVARGVR